MEAMAEGADAKLPEPLEVGSQAHQLRTAWADLEDDVDGPKVLEQIFEGERAMIKDRGGAAVQAAIPTSKGSSQVQDLLNPLPMGSKPTYRPRPATSRTT